jgi:hypothetical protein
MTLLNLQEKPARSSRRAPQQFGIQIAMIARPRKLGGETN